MMKKKKEKGERKKLNFGRQETPFYTFSRPPRLNITSIKRIRHDDSIR